MNYTKEQELAINQQNSNLLVSAAAGSGKTAVLVERILRQITNVDSPRDIDRLLIVTFSDAAAMEMRERITKTITEKLEKDPINENLRRQIFLLNKASISTLHSFCNSIIRNHFHLVNIDSSYRVGEVTEIELIKDEAMEEVFEKEHEDADPLFFDLIEYFSDRFTDDNLKNLVLRVFEFSQNSISPREWLNNSCNNFLIETNNIDETFWADIVMDSINNNLKLIRNYAETTKTICYMDNGPYKYLDAIESDIEIIEGLINISNHGFSYLYREFNDISYKRLASIRKDDNVDPVLQSKFRSIRDDDIKDGLNSLKSKFFFKDPDAMLSDLKSIYPYMKKLIDLVELFGDKFKEIKKDRNLLDFNDLEHYAYEILRDNPDIAEEYQEKYLEVFVDEYQDINDIQEAVLSIVSKEDNRFMVGDLKQSIYKFRRARPEIFKEKYQNYTYNYDTDINTIVDLSKNFRSREGVLNGVNFLFNQLFSLEVGDVNYSSSEKLFLGGDFKEIEKEKIDIVLTSMVSDLEDTDDFIVDLQKAEAEIKVIRKKIQDLINGEFKLYDKEKEAFVNPRLKDIVILSRTMANTDNLIEELNKLNIPAYADTTTGYFENIEVITILNLLRIIDNPMQDIPLAGILHSPIYSFTADELWELRRAKGKDFLYNSMVYYTTEEFKENNIVDNYVLEKINRFLEDLDYFREASKISTVSRLLGIIYNRTQYYNYVGAMTNGGIRQSNLKLLEQYALRFEKTSLIGLFSFIRYIEKLIERDSDLGNAVAVGENEDAIRIMSIHKSKGLEFPIVILAFTGKGFNPMDERQSIILHSDYGFGPVYVDLKSRVKSNTLARMALREKIRIENISEELRILYVALTRAEEKLIISGCVDDMEKEIANWIKFIDLDDEKIPPQYILDSKNFINLIMTCLLRHRDLNFFAKGYDELLETPKNKELYEDKSNWGIEVYNLEDIYQFDNDNYQDENYIIDNYHIDILEKLENKLNWVYPYEKDVEMPTKISISEIKRNYYSQNKIDTSEDAQDYFPINLNEPEIIKRKRDLTAAEKGTAIHTVVENLDLSIIKNREDIEKLLDDLYNHNVLDNKEKESIDIDKILKYINSDLAKRISISNYAKQEVPFVLEITPDEAYIVTDTKTNTLINGIIDLFFIEDNKIVLVDFKSDYVNKNDIESFTDKYEIQMKIYKKALKNIYNMEVKEIIIYSFYLNKEIYLEDI